MSITHDDTTQVTKHPLDPLTAQEIASAAGILHHSQRLTSAARVITISLHEPAKEAVLAFQPGQALKREAFVVIREHTRRQTIEAIISLADETIRSWRELSDVQPSLTLEEVLAAEEAIRLDARWQEAMRRRGITDFSSAVISPWTAGYMGPADAAERGRFLRPLTTISRGPDDNYYAQPVEGVIVTVDLDTMAVVEVEDHGVVPLPLHMGNYTPVGITSPENVPSFPGGLRADLRPIAITQPEGPSFQVDGYGVSWQKWHFRVGFTPREGLVLHLVEYLDRGRRRPILYRGGLSEMVVPYGDPTPTHYRKNVFDAGEVGIGVLANSLMLGCDCLGEIHYFDVTINDQHGQPVALPNAICMHEEDVGLLWKHIDFRTNKAEVRRSRRLVISSISSIGNYEYGFFWYLYQDGTIQYEVKLTGVVATGAIAPGTQPVAGSLIAPGLYSPNHQHIFNVRLDMMVDGLENSAYEVNSEPLPWGPDNPHGNAWVARETLLASESEAQRTIEPMKSRYWKIVNSSSLNHLGQPVAYKLVPGDNAFPLYQEGSSPMRRAGFARNHLWVTAYDPAERYAAGDYPNQHPGGEGLPAYVQKDRSVEKTDLVVWYTFVSHHIVRPEDWPVMPVESIGFRLKPVGFFDGNPALDVPDVGA